MYILDPLLTPTQIYTEVYLRIPTQLYIHLHLVSLKVFHQPRTKPNHVLFFCYWEVSLRQLVFRLQSERGHQIPSKHPGVKAQETGFKSNVANIQLQVKMKVRI